MLAPPVVTGIAIARAWGEHDLEKVAVARLHSGAATDRLASHDALTQRGPIHFGASC